MGRVAGTEVGRCPWCARARVLVGPGASGAPSIVPGVDRPGSTPLRFLWGTPHAGNSEEGAMEVLYPRCAGLDVHKDAVVASARLATGRDVTVEVRTFPTTTAGLLALSAWLAEH